MSSPLSHRHLRGFTLVEVIIFIVVVSAAMAGILSVMNTTVKSSADPMVRKQALAIAESLLEEILMKEHSKPSGSTVVAYGATGWSRAKFDTVDDYKGYATTGGLKGITDAQGSTTAAVPGLSGYNITSVSVSNPTTLTGGGTTQVKKVEVTVTDTQNNTMKLIGYRGDY
jgi:MSHA pilin protein MshD